MSLTPAGHVGYRPLLAAAGPRFLLLGFLGRLPASMLPLGLLLAAASGRGFAFAGLVVAALSLGGAVGGPVGGHLADRYGHRRFGLAVTALGAIALACFIGAALHPTYPPVVLVAIGAVLGLANSQTGAMARGRWTRMVRDRPDGHALTSSAMGWEAAVDEVGFVVGPIIVGLLAGIATTTALLATLVLMLVGQIGFALDPSARRTCPTPVATTGRPRSRFAWMAGSASLLVLTVAVGLVFGSTQAAVAATLSRTDQTQLTGIVYGALGAASAAAGLLVSRLPPQVSYPYRILGGGILLVAASGGLLVVSTPVGLGLGCALLGLAVGPIMVTSFTMAARRTSLARHTTMMSLLGASTATGVAAGTAAAGLLVDIVGPAAGFSVGIAAGLTACFTASAILLPRTRPRRD